MDLQEFASNAREGGDSQGSISIATTDCEDAFADRHVAVRQRVISERVRPTRDIMDDTPAW
jgi:hypothetical protein